MNIQKIVFSFSFLIMISIGHAQPSDVIASKFFLDVGYGYGLRTSKAPSGKVEKDMYDNVKSGGNLNLEFGYKLNPQSSLSVAFNRYGFSGTVNSNTLTIANVNFGSGTWKSKGNISFVGPKYNYHFDTSNKGQFSAGLGLGLLSYKSEDIINANISSVRAETKGNSFGVIATADYYYFITKNLAIGAKLGLITGRLSKVKVTSGGNTVEQKIDSKDGGLGQFNINGGFRIFF